MISLIGYMIGFYILTRMVAIVFPKGEAEKPVVQILTVLTILVVILSLILFFTTGLKTVGVSHDVFQ